MDEPDERSLMTYISGLYDIFPAVPDRSVPSAARFVSSSSASATAASVGLVGVERLTPPRDVHEATRQSRVEEYRRLARVLREWLVRTLDYLNSLEAQHSPARSVHELRQTHSQFKKLVPEHQGELDHLNELHDEILVSISRIEIEIESFPLPTRACLNIICHIPRKRGDILYYSQIV